MIEKPILVKYVNRFKRWFIGVSAVLLCSTMICLVFAFAKWVPFYFVTPVLIIGELVFLGYYELRVSMGTVIGIEVTDEVVHIKTKRRTFTYDVRSGCVGVKADASKFVATFQTQDSRDSFVFYRRVPFSRGYDPAFTADDLRTFYPAVDDVENGQ